MTAPNTLPDPQTAINNLVSAAYQRVFFSKCAAFGLEPRNEKQAAWMLESAAKLRLLAESAPNEKLGADQDPLDRFTRSLDHALAQRGLANPTKQAHAQESDQAYRDAALHLAGDPLLYNSVLSVKAAEAEKLKADYDQWTAQQRQSA